MLTGQGLGARRVGWVVALVAAGVVLLATPRTAPAADVAPQITAGPTIAGLAQVGETLTAHATWTGSPAPTVKWRWARCERPNASCSAIKGATSDSYRLTAADVGFYVRVVLTVTNAAGSAEKRSETTVAVKPLPAPAPTPVPTPPPAPAPTPPPPAPVPTPAPPPPPAFELPPAATPPAVRAPDLLSPFPVVRIKGWITARGARITLFTVSAPRGARIDVTCRGTACPVPKLATTAAVGRLRRFERELRAGTRLDVTVTKPGAIGKWTEIVIRRGVAPRRKDGCIDSDSRRHVRCPT
jgi:TusA-related sulfurtransferase